MSKTKKILINIGCGLLLLCAGFGAGRGLRLARTSGASSKLESGIHDARDTADSISDKLNTAGSLGSSAASSGQAISDGVGAIEQSSSQLRIFYDEVIRSIEADQKATDDFKRLHNASSEAAVDALDIAIQHSEQYEQLILSLQQAVDNFAKDNQESK